MKLVEKYVDPFFSAKILYIFLRLSRSIILHRANEVHVVVAVHMLHWSVETTMGNFQFTVTTCAYILYLLR